MVNVSQSKNKSSNKDVNIMDSFCDRFRPPAGRSGQLDSTEAGLAPPG
jgi:hypothetical protein